MGCNSVDTGFYHMATDVCQPAVSDGFQYSYVANCSSWMMESYVGFGCEGYMYSSQNLSLFGNVTCDGYDCDYALMFQPVEDYNGTFNGTLQYAWNGTDSPTSEPTMDPTSLDTLEPTTDPTSEPTTDPTSEPTMDPVYCDLESYQSVAIAMGCFNDVGLDQYYQCDNGTVSVQSYTSDAGECDGMGWNIYYWEDTCLEWQCYDAGESFEYNETDNMTYLYDGFVTVRYGETFDNGTCDYSDYSGYNVGMALGCRMWFDSTDTPFGIDLYCSGNTLLLDVWTGTQCTGVKAATGANYLELTDADDCAYTMCSSPSNVTMEPFMNSTSNLTCNGVMGVTGNDSFVRPSGVCTSMRNGTGYTS